MNRAKKRIFRLLLAALMTFALLPAAALAAGDAFVVTTDRVLGVDYTYDASGVLTFKNPGYYTVSMALPGSTTTTDIIVVEGGTAEAPVNLTLNGVNISSNSACALEVKDSPPSYLNLTLVGANTLSSGDSFPGIRCQQGATLTIDGGGVLTATGGGGGAGISGGRDGSGGDITITGGSVKAISGGDGAQAVGHGADGTDSGSLENNNDENVYLTTVTLKLGETDVADAQVSSLTFSPEYAYGVDDVVTDSDGKLYLYLPAGTETTAAQAADSSPPHTIRKYTGRITTIGDHTAAGELIVQLAAPDVLAWDGATPGKVTWNAVANADSYTVQLYKNSAAQGSAVTGVTVTEYDFTSDIALAGTGNYTFTVIAAGNGVNYSDSDPSAESAAYTTPAINPVSRNYDLNAPADVTTAITWNGAASVTSVVYGAYTLVQDTDYTLAGNDLTVEHSYLSGLSLTIGDTLEFTINFNTGATAALTVNVVNSYVPSSNANLSSLSVNGTPVSDYDPNDTEYDVELPYGSSSATVTATVDDPLASCVITDAPSLPGSATVTVTAEDGTTKTYTINFTIGAAPITYTITASAGSGGSISPSGAVSVGSGGSQTFTITPNSGYQIKSVTVDGINQGAITTYTFTDVTANHTINATFAVIDDGGGEETQSTPAASSYNAVVQAGSGKGTTLRVSVDKDARTASVDAGSLSFDKDGTVIKMPSIPGVDTYTVGMSVLELSTSKVRGTLTLDTDVGSVTVPSNMLTGVPGISGSKAEISIGKGDKDNLRAALKAAIGDRPLIRLTLSIDGKQTNWSNPDAPVTVSIPYTPTEEELANPENIVVWYIDGSGNAVCVPNGRYDPDTGTVTFTTTHFSDYAVVYNKVTFRDVAADAWYSKAVSFIAAREIAAGTGDGHFSPEAKLTRGQFIVMLMKAYGITPDANPQDNFADAGSTWYTGYLAAVKRLGISSGIGNNLFAPEKEITRQEMFTLLYNELKTMDKLPRGNSGKTLSSFTDAGDIAPWARDAMKFMVENGTISGSGGKLAPLAATTRAEMAQVLSNLLGK